VGALKNGGQADRELLGALPDEFHGWVDEVAARLVATVERNAAEVEHAYSQSSRTLPTRWLLAQGLRARGEELLRTPHLFARHDGKDYRPRLWDAATNPRSQFAGPRGIAPTVESA
jgi:RNA ligase